MPQHNSVLEAPDVDGSPAAGARAGDDSLRELYDDVGQDLLRYLLRLTRGDRHRAEDILQETLVRAWRHPEVMTETEGWSRRWLFTVAHRVAIDFQRAQMSRPTEVGDDRLAERPHPEDSVERMLNRMEVRSALNSLPARLRDVLIEVYFKERSAAEAAEILGVPTGTVKSRTFYALRALRLALEERGFALSPG